MKEKLLVGGVALILVLSLLSVFGLIGVNQSVKELMQSINQSVVDMSQQLGAITFNGGGYQPTKFNEISDQAASYQWVAMNIPAASSTAFVQNGDKFTRYVDLATILTSGTSTSTPYRIYVATTSGPRTLPSSSVGTGQKLPLYGALSWSGLINAFPLASTSAATTTSSLDRWGGDTLTGAKIFPWKAGEWIGAVLQVNAGATAVSSSCPNQTGGNNCESATSSARGFNVDILLRTFATSTGFRI
jgi:hypothetical protein